MRDVEITQVTDENMESILNKMFNAPTMVMDCSAVCKQCGDEFSVSFDDFTAGLMGNGYVCEGCNSVS